ncbi:MAG: GTPase Era [Rikenellaceae bacterium]|nr:GTPase Era [Rikenellaceae bacterium]MDE7356278.1 GTPase Era [Rikenellaceae bacterium]
MFKSGFVNIVGNPNVGKSTLMNALVGERISIITSKAQTTRHRIMGIVNGNDFQIVYSDTPGVLKPNYKLQESMLRFSVGALVDADVLLYVTDTVEEATKHADFIDKVKLSAIPTLLVINKIDLTDEAGLAAKVELWKGLLPEARIIPTSATNNFNIDNLFRTIVELLPPGEPYYPTDALTDKPLRFFASEIIRSQILLNYDKEIPYCVEIVIESYKESPTIDRIGAVIYVARNSQKGIIIGHKGQMLKKIGTAARKELEDFLQKKVFLEIFVKASENWRNDERMLRNFGYIDRD